MCGVAGFFGGWLLRGGVPGAVCRTSRVDDKGEQFGGTAATTLEEALAPLPAPRLIAGSLYLAGEVLRLNRQFPD